MKLKLNLSLILMVGFNLCYGEVTLPAIFCDHMILQQKSKVAFWGKADKEETIVFCADFLKKGRKTIADHNGQWKIEIETPSFGGPYTLSITGKNKIELKDIYIGDVWIASGQSNMEFFLDSMSRGYSGVINRDIEIKNSNLPQIREFNVKNNFSQNCLDDLVGEWKVCTPQNSGGFSAVAYYFAKKLNKELNIPIGIINATWGGTPTEAWLRPEEWEFFNNSSSESNRINSNNAKISAKSPTVLYNGMINPIKNYATKGVIWYQGESNINNAEEYHLLMEKLIHGWRIAFNNKNLPFLFVQIAPYNYKNVRWFHGDEASLPILVEQQKSLLKIRNTGMARTGDIGDINNIHPKQKKEAGERLALVALGEIYKKDIIYEGPNLKSWEIKGDEIILNFSNTYSGLSLKDSVSNNFEVAGKDSVFYPVNPIVEKNRIIIKTGTTKPVYMRYAYNNTSFVDLFNSAGLPAVPFKIHNLNKK